MVDIHVGLKEVASLLKTWSPVALSLGLRFRRVGASAEGAFPEILAEALGDAYTDHSGCDAEHAEMTLDVVRLRIRLLAVSVEL